MATELASGYVSVSGDTRPLARDIRSFFARTERDARSTGARSGSAFGSSFGSRLRSDRGPAEAGAAQGRNFARAFARTASTGTKGFITTLLGLSTTLRTQYTALKQVTFGFARMAVGLKIAALGAGLFARHLMRSNTLLRMLSGRGLLKIAGILRIVAGLASKVATQIARVTSMLVVLQTIATAFRAMTGIARFLAMATMGAGALLGVVSALGSVAGGAIGALGAAIGTLAAGFGAAAASAVGILGPAIAVVKIGLKGMGDGAKSFLDQFKDADKVFNDMIGKRMGPLLGAFRTLRMEITDNLTSAMEPAFGKMGSLITALAPPLNGLSRIIGKIGVDIVDSLAGPQAKAGLQEMIYSSQTFFAGFRQGESGFGAIVSAMVALLGRASTLFAGAGQGLNDKLLNIADRINAIDTSKLQGAIQNVKDLFANVQRYVQNWMQIIGPAFNLFKELGQRSTQALAPGFQAIGKAIGDATPGLIKIADNLMPALGQVMQNLAPALPALVQAFTPMSQIIAILAPPLASMVASLAPLAPLLLGFALAIKLISTVMVVYNAAMLIGSNITKIWSGIQIAFNAILGANPIVLVVIAIVALVAAIVIAYKNSETFRNIVQAAWEGIKTAISVVWNSVLKPIFDAFMTVLRAVGAVVMWIWQNVITPAFNAIKFVISVWWAFVQIYFKLWQIAIQAIGDIVMWFWHNVIEPAFNAIGAVISAVWDAVIKPIFDTFMQVLGFIGDKVNWLWQNVMVPAWEGIQTAIKKVWDFIKPILDNIGKGIQAVGDIAAKVGDAMRSAFSGVVDVLKVPVHFVGGLLADIPTSILGIDIPGADTIKSWGQTLQGLASGGTIGQARRSRSGLLSGPGTGTSDSILGVNGAGRPIVRVANGEGVVKKAAMDSGGAGIVAALNSGRLQGLAAGGTIGYGLPPGSGSNAKFPQWVLELASKFGVKPSTYPGHQENDRKEPGFAPNPQHLNRGIDWGGTVPKMQAFADFLMSIAPKTPALEQVIWMNPQTGKKEGWFGGRPDTGGSIYAGDYSGHQNHVHTRQSGPIGATNAVAPAVVPGTKTPTYQSPQLNPDGTPQSLGTGTSSGSPSTKEPYSPAKTTKEFLGNAGKIVGESLFDILVPSQLADIDPVAIGDRYTLKDSAKQDEQQQSTPSTSSQTPQTVDPNANAQQAVTPPPAPAQPPRPAGLDMSPNGIAQRFADAVKARKLSTDAGVILGATGLVESDMRILANPNVPESMSLPHNGTGTDHDSVGPLQQRNSWGPAAVRMDPFKSAGLFLDKLVQFNWQSMPPGDAAQKVQVSAYPGKYAQRMAEARKLMIGKFDRGGVVPPGISLVENRLRRYEQAAVFTPQQWDTLGGLPDQMGGGGDFRTHIEKLVVADWREAQKELRRFGNRQQMRYSRSHTK
ncbi:tape measure protein [Gordonia phage Margaret]|nr:tape measure protein [Gordonia phage Margaret]